MKKIVRGFICVISLLVSASGTCINAAFLKFDTDQQALFDCLPKSVQADFINTRDFVVSDKNFDALGRLNNLKDFISWYHSEEALYIVVGYIPIDKNTLLICHSRLKSILEISNSTLNRILRTQGYNKYMRPSLSKDKKIEKLVKKYNLSINKWTIRTREQNKSSIQKTLPVQTMTFPPLTSESIDIFSTLKVDNFSDESIWSLYS